MATYYVDSTRTGGANTGGSWTNAYLAFGSAVTAATAGTDIIYVSSVHQEELGADTTFTFTSGTRVICLDSSDDSLATMGSGGWIGNSTANRGIILAGTDSLVYFYGITFRISGTTSDSFTAASGTGCNHVFESCLLWISNTGTTSVANLSGVSAKTYWLLCEFLFGNTAQSGRINGGATFVGCTFCSSGSIPTGLFGSTGDAAVASFVGCTFTNVNTTLVRDTALPFNLTFERCKFGALTVLATQTSNPTGASAEVLLTDCKIDTTDIPLAHYNVFGSTIPEASIYYTGGAAGSLSWKVVTSATVKHTHPYQTPWIDWYNTGTSSITPRLEVLRDGSATAYQNDEIWGEFTVKTSADVATSYIDRMAVNGSAANQDTGAGAGSWTGENATAWSGKCDSGAAVTPNESGYIRGRLVVGEPSITVYLDPVIRTA